MNEPTTFADQNNIDAFKKTLASLRRGVDPYTIKPEYFKVIIPLNQHLASVMEYYKQEAYKTDWKTIVSLINSRVRQLLTHNKDKYKDLSFMYKMVVLGGNILMTKNPKRWAAVYYSKEQSRHFLIINPYNFYSMIMLCKDVDEDPNESLLFILRHESAHIINRHLTTNYIAKYHKKELSTPQATHKRENEFLDGIINKSLIDDTVHMPIMFLVGIPAIYSKHPRQDDTFKTFSSMSPDEEYFTYSEVMKMLTPPPKPSDNTIDVGIEVPEPEGKFPPPPEDDDREYNEIKVGDIIQVGDKWGKIYYASTYEKGVIQDIEYDEVDKDETIREETIKAASGES